MLSFENFVKSMPPSLSELKVTPSFCFAFKIPDDRAASTELYHVDNISSDFTVYYYIMLIFFFPLQLSSDRGESSLVNVSETDSGALDLSSGSRDRENMKSRSSVASHISHHSSSYQSEGKDFFETCYLPLH